MALSNEDIRRILEDADTPAENINKAMEKIRDKHKESLSYLKDDVAAMKAENETLKTKLSESKAKIGEYEQQLKDAEKGKADSTAEADSKYKKLSEEFEKYKADVSAKEARSKSETTLFDWLVKGGYSESAANLIVHRSDYPTKITYDDNGKATNLKDIVKEIQAERDFAGFTPKTDEKHHVPDTPPASAGGAFKSKKEIMEIKDATERQAAIKEAILNGSTEFGNV